MANRSKFQNQVFLVLGLFSLMLLVPNTGASEFKVGGSKNWIVPANGANIYNSWAEKMRFQIGDSLLFVYQPSQDSVLYVKADDYNNCNNNSYITKYTDGHTVFQFNQSGPFHFISGNKDNCLKNEKLIVVVMADRNRNNSKVSSPPSGSPGTNPAPAPAAEEAPSPPEGMGQPTPAPAPSNATAPAANGAGSVFAGLTGSIGALFVASYLLTVF